MSDALWYVEAFDRFDTHNGGFMDISDPFETEQAAREYAEQVGKECVTVYRCEDNRFVDVDTFIKDADYHNPAGWKSQYTDEQREQYHALKKEQAEIASKQWFQELFDNGYNGLGLPAGYILYPRDMAAWQAGRDKREAENIQP